MRIYRLDNPYGLLFLLIPLLCLAVVLLSRFFFKKGARVSTINGYKNFISLRIYGYFISLFFILLGMSLIAFSLSKPQFGIKKEKIITEGIDIMIALDVSGSMTTSDFFSYSRIEGAKNILQKFVTKRKGDRIGLVTFSESSFLKCPATVNFDLLTKVIGKIFIDPNKQSSTSIGIGLSSAINRLLQMKDNVNPDSKIAILVTDGINNSGEISPEAAMEIALQTGIKVYTVGIGESNEVDVKLLGDIANRTKGKFFHAKNTGELGPIFDEIDKIEKRKIETLEFVRYKDIGYKYALAGIIIMISGLLLNGLFFKRLG